MKVFSTTPYSIVLPVLEACWVSFPCLTLFHPSVWWVLVEQRFLAPKLSNALKIGAYIQSKQLNMIQILQGENRNSEQPKQTYITMTAQETFVHGTSKCSWLIGFGLSLGLVPDIQPPTFCSVSQYGILKRCCRNCKTGVQSDAILSNRFPTAIHCSSCFLSPTITSVLPFPFYLHLSPPRFLFLFFCNTTLSSCSPRRVFISWCKSVSVHWWQWELMSAKNLADNTCLKCRNSVLHPCLSSLWTLCLCAGCRRLAQPLLITSSP